MKLYATTTSERATKGQGGNQYLQIQLAREDKVIFGSITVLPNQMVYGSIHGNKFDFSLIKGEKQKGEKYWCINCNNYSETEKCFTCKDNCILSVNKL
jgi:hypothetical protein